MTAPRTIRLCGRDLEPPGHVCAFFDSRDQQYDVLAPYYKDGIDDGDEVVTIVNADHVADHQERLRARGIDVDAAEASGQLHVVTADETYTADGRFEADRMFHLLERTLADAQQRQRRVRATGVMDWASQNFPGTSELLDYELRVNELAPVYGCTLVCVYDLAELSGPMVMDILRTHPFVIHGARILENSYYIPPDRELERLA